LELFGYIAAAAMGLTLGMIGGGGSILTVPILVYLFNIGPVLASAYSLFIVGLTALVGGLRSLQKGEVDLKTGLVFAGPSFVGVYVTRAFVVPNLSDPVFTIGAGLAVSKAILVMGVFAVLMIAASISMIRAPGRGNGAGERQGLAPRPPARGARRFALIGAEGLVVGAITGFVGAGGGFLIIPALVVIVGLPMRIAIGTSLLIIAVKSLFGFLGDIHHQADIDWRFLLILSAIAIGGLFFGMRLSSKVSERALKNGFGYFVLGMGVLILLDQVRRL
jgi:hypothetical protein